MQVFGEAGGEGVGGGQTVGGFEAALARVTPGAPRSAAIWWGPALGDTAAAAGCPA